MKETWIVVYVGNADETCFMYDHSLKWYKHQVEETWVVVYVWNVDHWVEGDLDRSLCVECG